MKEIWKLIQKNVKTCLSDLDSTAVRTNRELLYGAIACFTAGAAFGMLLSPKVNVSVGNNNTSGKCAPAAPKKEEE